MVNPIRFGGIASGLDTESLVKQLVSAEKSRLNKFSQQKIWKQWQQSAYNETNKIMANFIIDSRKNLGLTRTTSTGSLISGSINTVDWIKKATTSSSLSFDVTASASAPSGVSTIKVNELATGANVSSQNSIKNIDGTDIAKASDIVGLTFNNGETQININGKEIKLLADDTLSQIAQKIRTSLPDLNVNYDLGSDRFFISTKATGAESKIQFGTDLDTTNFLAAMQFTDFSKIEGTNAKIEYNGGSEIEYKSNNISINGLNLTLKSKSTVTETINVSTDVDGAYNKIKEFVDEYNKLIDVFNGKLSEKKYRDFSPLTDDQKTAMSENDVKLWEEKAKSGLLNNDSTINKMLQTVRQDLYKPVFNEYSENMDDAKRISETIGSLYDFGITTGNWRDNGKLTIDEFKLKDALRNDSEKVLNTLFKTSNTQEVTINSTDKGQTLIDKQNLISKRNSESGVFIRIFDNLTAGIKDVVSKSGPGDDSTLLRNVKTNILIDYLTAGYKSIIDDEINDIDKRISRETERLTSLEERYWRQFTALEKAMSQMNSQSSWLSQQFGGGQQ